MKVSSNNAGIDACLKMATMFLAEEWGNGVAKHWIQVEINPNLNIIKLEIGTKHPDGTREIPYKTYRFNNDGTYTSQTHS